MRISESQFADLKVRFEKYFQNVPTQLWFAGRRDAPAPKHQISAVQQMFGIDLSAVGGDPAPERKDHAELRGHRELRVAISRLEQWEAQQRILSKRENGTKSLSIEDCDFSVKTYNVLKNAGFSNLAQLADITEAELLRIKNCGWRACSEVKEVLKQVGLRLKGDSQPLEELEQARQSDLNTVVTGIKKLPEDEAREVSLCLLNLLLPLAVNNQGGTNLLRHLRDGLLGE